MATYKALLDKRYKSKDNTYNVIVRVRHQHQVREFGTGYGISEMFWDHAKQQVKKAHYDAVIINARISEILTEIKSYLADCSVNKKSIFLDRIGTDTSRSSFIEYMKTWAKHYWAKKQIGTAQKFDRFVVELKDCFGAELFFEEITLDDLRKYDRYLDKAGNIENTRYKKFARLRQQFDRAIKEGITKTINPFYSYKLSKYPVKKPKLDSAEIEMLEKGDLSGMNDLARDMFLFSFYCKGIRFEKVATFRKENIVAGRLHWTANKGRKHHSVKIHSRLQALIDKYGNNESEFLFPLIKGLPTDPLQYKRHIESNNTIINKHLAIVQGILKIEKKVRFHIARHSFAQLAKVKNTPIEVIQEALGHSDAATTRGYLEALGDEHYDPEMQEIYGS